MLESAIRNHSALRVAILKLAIEWGTQRHYVDSTRDDRALDSQFKSLLKNHRREEPQHVKVDGMVFGETAARVAPGELAAAGGDFAKATPNRQDGAFLHCVG